MTDVYFIMFTSLILWENLYLIVKYENDDLFDCSLILTILKKILIDIQN